MVLLTPHSAFGPKYGLLRVLLFSISLFSRGSRTGFCSVQGGRQQVSSDWYDEGKLLLIFSPHFGCIFS